MKPRLGSFSSEPGGTSMKSPAVALTVAAKIGPPAPSAPAHAVLQDRRLERDRADTETGIPLPQSPKVVQRLPCQHIVVNREGLLDIFVLGILEGLVKAGSRVAQR